MTIDTMTSAPNRLWRRFDSVGGASPTAVSV